MQLTLFASPAAAGAQRPAAQARGDEELRALYAGRPRVPCTWCGAMAAEGSVCPLSIRCPTCGRGPGRRCRRPSEHGAAEMHAPRWQAAEAIDRLALPVACARTEAAPA
jgi:hypothetical protein